MFPWRNLVLNFFLHLRVSEYSNNDSANPLGHVAEREFTYYICNFLQFKIII